MNYNCCYSLDALVASLFVVLMLHYLAIFKKAGKVVRYLGIFLFTLFYHYRRLYKLIFYVILLVLIVFIWKIKDRLGFKSKI